MSYKLILENVDNGNKYSLQMGVLSLDPSSTAKNATVNAVYRIEKTEDYAPNVFNFFKEHRGETFRPFSTKNNKGRIEILSDADTINDFKKFTKYVECFGDNESALEIAVRENVVAFRYSAENPQNGTVSTSLIQYAFSSDFWDILISNAYNYGTATSSVKSELAQPRQTARYGLALYYNPDENAFIPFSYYRCVGTNTTENDHNLVAFNNSVEYPLIILRSNVTLPDNRIIIASNFLRANDGNIDTVLYHALHPEYNNSLFLTNYENAIITRFFFYNAVEPTPSGGGGEYPTPNPQEPDGGDGNFDDGSDPMPQDPIENLAIGDMVHVYELSTEQLSSLHSYLWSDNMINNFLQGIQQDPFSCLVGLQYMPIAPATGGANIMLGNVNTEIAAASVPNRIYNIDFGNISIAEYWGNFLDYNPYTRVQLFLPYCSTIDIDTDKVMNSTLSVNYRIDVLSGGILATVLSNGNIIATATGNCATQIPLSVNDKSQMIANTIGGVIGFGLSAAGGSVAGMLSSTASIVTAQKTHPEIKGNYAGNIGSLGNRTPYLIISRPVASIPDKFAHNKGFRSNITRKVSDCSGFTKYDSIHIDGVSCTDEERTEIMELLTNGIII